MIIPEINPSNSNQLRSEYFEKNYPELYDFLQSNYPENISFVEKLYWYFHGLETHPVCEICGNPTRFVSYSKGYKRACSAACSAKTSAVKEKARQTCLSKYGVDNASKNKEIIDKIVANSTEKYGGMGAAVPSIYEKMKSTNKKLYGAEHPIQNDSIKQKAQITCLERYGTKHYTQSDEYKIKSKQTCVEKYGVEHPAQNTDIKLKAKDTCLERYGGQGNEVKEFLEKSKQTRLERYGDENYTNREKSKQTCIERYGGVAPAQNKDISKKIIDTRRANQVNSNDFMISYTDTGEWVVKCPHEDCDKCQEKQFVISRAQYWNRTYMHAELCTILHPIGEYPNKNTAIEVFVKNILDKHNVEYECNNRSVLSGKEIDIYVPSKKIGIECNGIYWHSTSSPNKKPLSYHFNKWKECKENGIQLLTIWEDQIINKPDIVESIILSKLGIYERRIYARNCQVKEVDSKECYSFLKAYHLQGASNSKVRYGLYYNDELVSVMTFGLKRRCMGGKGEWELHRYCNKKGVQVIGGASRLFNHFIKAQKPAFIESFSSNDISDGRLYETLKFDMLKCEYGSYWYIDKNMNRHHRYNFRKDQLVKEGFDASKSEFTIMEERGYYRIYDSGQTKWVYKKENQ